MLTNALRCLGPLSLNTGNGCGPNYCEPFTAAELHGFSMVIGAGVGKDRAVSDVRCIFTCAVLLCENVTSIR